ncbi:MAG TPA: hypothetical protein PLX09_04220 [Xanthomonadaceae bacterium]|nr:hypothetical protein [Xanthomonadaceae bacterium]
MLMVNTLRFDDRVELRSSHYESGNWRLGSWQEVDGARVTHRW